jgi:hypothetical protein
MVPTMTASVGRLGGLGLDLVADTGVLQIIGPSRRSSHRKKLGA